MTGSAWIEGPALEEFLPHRGLNLLIDGVRMLGDGCAESTLCLSSGDQRGRDIFLRKRGAGDDGSVIIEPALAEHLALCAIHVMAPGMAPGEIAFFSTISKFALAREPAEGEKLVSSVKRLRDKGRFRRFEGAVKGADGEDVARAEIMAYAADPRETGGGESGKLVAAPKVSAARPVDRNLFAWKRPEMVFLDEIVDAAEDRAHATFRYSYPPDHPFCPGHFPGNPVMMGIAQWIAACDAAAFLAHEYVSLVCADPGSGGEPFPSNRFTADAEMLRETGALVAEVRGLVFATGAGPAGSIAPVRLAATKRVGFRDQVRPGETVFVRVTISPEG